MNIKASTNYDYSCSLFDEKQDYSLSFSIVNVCNQVLPDFKERFYLRLAGGIREARIACMHLIAADPSSIDGLSRADENAAVLSLEVAGLNDVVNLYVKETGRSIPFFFHSVEDALLGKSSRPVIPWAVDQDNNLIGIHSDVIKELSRHFRLDDADGGGIVLTRIRLDGITAEMIPLGVEQCVIRPLSDTARRPADRGFFSYACGDRYDVTVLLPLTDYRTWATAEEALSGSDVAVYMLDEKRKA